MTTNCQRFSDFPGMDDATSSARIDEAGGSKMIRQSLWESVVELQRFLEKVISSHP